MTNILILGAGGHAKEVFSTIQDINAISKKYNVIGFYDDMTDRTRLLDRRVYKTMEDIKNGDIKLIIGVGTPEAKSILITKFRNRNFEFERLIHPTTLVSPYAHIGKGAVIQSYCIIQPDVKIGDYFTCNDNVQIGHDTIIGNNVHINSNVNISGGAYIGDDTFIGVKATIMSVRIGKNCIIGACSLINKDVPDNSKAKGIPATYTPSDGRITFGTR